MAEISRAAADRAASVSSGVLDAAARVTVAIPTDGREETLVETIRHVLRVAPEGIDLVLAHQTDRHAAGVAQVLEDLERDGNIRLLRLPAPSIPVAMNAALAVVGLGGAPLPKVNRRPSPLVSSAVALRDGRPGLAARRLFSPIKKRQVDREIKSFRTSSAHDYAIYAEILSWRGVSKR